MQSRRWVSWRTSGAGAWEWLSIVGIMVVMLLLLLVHFAKISLAAPLHGPLTISIKDSFYEPKDTTVVVGTSVTWTNQGNQRHTVTGVDRYDTTGSGGVKKLWDSDDLKPGQSYARRFDTVGTYRYLCERHQGQMFGTITVVSSTVSDVNPPSNPTPTPTPVAPPVATPTPALPPAATPTPLPPPGANAVSMGDNFFTPTSLTVSPGTAVTWTNNGKKPHTVTSDAGLWDSGTMSLGQSFSFTFNTPGIYNYQCIFHGGMVGTVNVSGAGLTPVPTPLPTPTPTPLVSPTPVSSPGSNAVSMGDDFFNPVSLSVSPGTTVTWINNGRRPHTVSSDAGLWDSGIISPGQSFSFTFNTPGAYSYQCIFHGGMVGTVTVSGSGSTLIPTPSPTLTPTPPANPTPVSSPGSNAVSMGDDFFASTSLTVSPGTAVTWTNNGKKPHTVTSDTGLWDSGIMSPGQSFSFTFNSPGAYTYQCILHNGMVGAVIVEDGPGITATGLTAGAEEISLNVVDLVDATSQVSEDQPSASDSLVSANVSDTLVSMLDNTFSPTSITVPVGATVTWDNNGQAPHTSTSKDRLWDSGMMKTGQSYSFRFDQPGLYEYVCLYHPGMVGSVTAQAGDVSKAASSVATTDDGAADPDQQSKETGVQVNSEQAVPQTANGQAGSMEAVPTDQPIQNPQGGILSPPLASKDPTSLSQSGDKFPPMVVNVMAPGPTVFEILLLMMAVGSIALSTVNLFIFSRLKR